MFTKSNELNLPRRGEIVEEVPALYWTGADVLFLVRFNITPRFPTASVAVDRVGHHRTRLR
jgi:hypothetical protein